MNIAGTKLQWGRARRSAPASTHRSPATPTAIGAAREAAVAAYEGGTVSRMKIFGPSASTDVDVIGKAGQYISVGGVAKDKDLATFGAEISCP